MYELPAPRHVSIMSALAHTQNGVRANEQSSPDLRHKVFFFEQVCLALTAQVAAIALCRWLFPGTERAFPQILTQMSVPQALAALLCSISLFLTEPERSSKLIRIGGFIAAGAALISLATFLDLAIPFPSAVSAFLRLGQAPQFQGTTILQWATCITLLAIVTILVHAENQRSIRIADFLMVCLSMLVLVLIWEYVFSQLGMFGASAASKLSLQALFCLGSLSTVAALREAEYGVFAIFLGSGIGSRIARGLTPVLLVLPLIREIGRERLLNLHLIPTHYSTALLASFSTAVLFVFVLLLARRINKMEKEIHGLTLRDGLTGLYNVKGFNLLAEQALRLAERAQLPFAVLFIDLDNLKEINDKFGHTIGSASLAELAKLLRATFRETDVIGRIGGDEFVVAGQFSEEIISSSIQRLRTACETRDPEIRRRFPLSFSSGYAICPGGISESLQDLVAKADEAMYQDKRRKKKPSN